MSFRRKLASLKLVAALVWLFSPTPRPEADQAEPHGEGQSDDPPERLVEPDRPGGSKPDQPNSRQERPSDPNVEGGRRPAKDKAVMHVFRFHEDDPGQIQILPIENWDHCQREFVAIEEHANQHWDPGGAGWSKMYMRGPCPVGLSELMITEEQFCEWLAPHSKRFDRVADPFDLDLDEDFGVRSIGFGPDEHLGVIAERRHEDEYITSIWCKVTADNVEIADMLSALSRDHHLMLVDWLSGEAVDLRSRTAIKRYLNGD